MERQHSVLIVEDDETLMLGLQENFRVAGYRVLTAANGLTGLQLAEERSPDLVILDVMLPGMNGFEICQALRVRGRRMPILMLTARQDETDKLQGFDMGADDYITKPFSIRELLARVKVWLAREERTMATKEKYTFDDFTLDMESHTLLRGGKEVPLTRTEFMLLAYFLANEGKALGRDLLMRNVWGVENLGTQRSLDTFVSVLRGKIEKNTQKPRHILTVHRMGYKFVK